MDETKTKGERREEKKRSRRKMRVVGRSARLLMELIMRRAKKADEGRS